MGQFKPMVKMMTTEPSVELKLKKGGPVKMQMGGMPPAAMPAAPAAPAMGRGMGQAMPGMAPKKPSMAARRRAMMARPSGAAPAAPVGMAGRMMKDGGDASLKAHAAKPASQAHKGLKTGGVVDGQGGYKSGGIIKSKVGKTTKVDTAKPDHSPAKTGVVKMGNAGGYATGGVAKANAGGYKKGGKIKKMAEGGGLGSLVGVPDPGSGGMPSFPKMPGFPGGGGGGGSAQSGLEQVGAGSKTIGDALSSIGQAVGSGSGGMAGTKQPSYAMKKGGSAKKAYATGGRVDTGRPVAMPQGAKKPSTPVSINQLSGTFKKGGKVTAAQGRLQKNFDKMNAPAMKEAKAYSNEVYSKYGKKMAGGGYADSEDAQMKSNREGYEAWEKSQGEENKATKKMVEDALMFVPRKLKKLFSGKPAPGSVTETKESVTVSPPQKKRGGAVTC